MKHTIDEDPITGKFAIIKLAVKCVQKATPAIRVSGYTHVRFPEPSAPTGGPHQSTTRPPIEVSEGIDVLDMPGL
jgi:hypothetical protein